jgi:CubicO group peptidase (beta-lactamase class C family)
MGHLNRLIGCGILTLFSLAAHQSTAQKGDADFNELEKVAFQELQDRRTPGAAIAVIKGDQVIYAKGFGVASVETGAPVTPETLFRLGSTTKMFTAAALVTLADQGKIKLDAPIGSYVKGLEPKLAQVTVHQLLTHTAGLRDFAASVVSNDEAALGASVRSWKEDVFFTAPGKIYSYSSPGYWLAGLVAEVSGGKLYADVLDELSFKPLGMSRTTLRPLVAFTYPFSQGHRVQGESPPVVIRPAFNNTAMWPGGSVYSNVYDLSRFVIALMNGGRLVGKQVLTQGVVAKLPAPHVVLPGEQPVNYGYGLMSFDYRGVRIVTHGGASTGYGSTIQIAPEQRFAVIVLTNKSGETLARTCEKSFQMFLPLGAEIDQGRRVAPPLTIAEMSNYAGKYRHHPKVWEVIVRNGKLFLKDDGIESELVKIGDHKFSFGRSGENELVFVPGEDGKAEYMFNGMYSARRAM